MAWSQLVEALRSTTTIETSRPIRTVLPDGRLIFDDQELRARTVVIAVPLGSAVKLFEDERLKQFHANALPARAACLDLVLSELPIPTQKIVLGIDEPLYAAVHRETENGIVFHAARYLAPGEEGRKARPSLEALLDAFQPGWRANVLEERFLPEMTVSSAIPRAVNAGKGFGVRLSANVFAAADWASGGMLSDGGLQAAHEVASIEGASVRLTA